jgi:hypothetical protein
MDQQTTLNGAAGNGAARPAHDLKAHVAGITRDVGRMAELQARLLLADLRQARARIMAAVICWVATAALALAALPVAVAGLGLWLADSTALSTAGGLLCAAAVAAALMMGLALAGHVQFRRQRDAWQRSSRELVANLHALRAAFARGMAAEPEES